jgi:hypothetical protein
MALVVILLSTDVVVSAGPTGLGQQAERTDLHVLPQPRRLVDTQPDSGYQGAGHPLSGLTNPACFQVAGELGVPDDASALMANLTALGYQEDGWITMFPAGASVPDTSNLNFDTDVNATANLVLVPIGDLGEVCAVGQSGTHLLLDVVGYMQPVSAVRGLTCPRAHRLESLLTCIVDQSGMRDESGVYVIPTDVQRADFGTAARAMVGGACGDIALGASLSGVYRVSPFTDVGNGRQYCVLMEIGDADGNGKIDHGWGTLIVDPSAARELNIAVAHPLDDFTTEDEGLGVFKATHSRSLLLAGSRRDLGGERSCPGEGQCPASDVAHNSDTMFFVATQQLADFYGSADWTQLQFHGNVSCPETDIHLSYGVRVPFTGSDKLSVLKSQLTTHHPDWLVTMFGEPGERCELDATTNVEGRLLNAGAPSAQRRFVHVEQYMDAQRSDRRRAENWIPVILDAFP